jgi:hypothetical protein
VSIDVQVQQPLLTVRPGETGRLKFTVTNVGETALPVVAQVVGASGGAPLPAGITTLDRPGRSLPAGGMDEFVVAVAPPLETTPATYGFVLHVASSSDDAVQVWGQSPQVAVTVPPIDLPEPPWWPKVAMVAVAVLIAVGIGFLAYQFTGGGSGWELQEAVIVDQTLRPGESIVVGVTNAATEQRLEFEGGVGTPERFAVSDAPIASTTSVPGADDVGEACLDALDDADEQTSVPVPIDGRPVCTFIGPGLIGVVGIDSLELDQVTLTMDVWSLQ